MFKIGERIVYPMHGAGKIECIESKTILDETRDYYVLKVPYGTIKLMIPVDKAEEIGVRPVIDSAMVDEVIEILKAPSSAMPANWNKRHRENMEKLKTGDIKQVAEVVRNLTRADEKKHLSTGERKILTNARQILQSEIMLAADMPEDEAENLIDSAL
ncbi:MAG: CarD family transcriptional regulator [Anaerovoracaceae bacterium]